MLLEERTVLSTAIREYGPEKQTMKAAEELCELAAALLRFRCLMDTGAADEEIHAAWDHVVEEMGSLRKGRVERACFRGRIGESGS